MDGQRMRSEILTLVEDLRGYLHTHADPIYASESDCVYFREKFRKKKVEPAPLPVAPPPVVWIEPPKLKQETPPPPPPKPSPVVVVEERISPQVLTPSFSKTLQEILAKVAPHLAILKEIPSDVIAKKINTRWKTKNQIAKITVLCDQEIPEQKALLEQIAKALDVCFGPAAFVSAEPIEKENQWEAFLSVSELELVICCDYTLWQLPKLRTFFKEVPAKQTRMLRDKPLFLLPDLSLYLKDPLLKRSLWKALCSLPSSSTKT